MALTLSLILATAMMQHSHEQHRSHYRGLENREIKTLSEDEIRGLREGEGMSMALVAELNHYPGPRHVLELADELEISPEQREETQDIFDRMHLEAVRLGEEIVERERELEVLFRTEGVSGATAELVIEIGRLRGELRWAHLRAHLETRELLTESQRESYDRLRGYTK